VRAHHRAADRDGAVPRVPPRIERASVGAAEGEHVRTYGGLWLSDTAFASWAELAVRGDSRASRGRKARAKNLRVSCCACSKTSFVYGERSQSSIRVDNLCLTQKQNSVTGLSAFFQSHLHIPLPDLLGQQCRCAMRRTVVKRLHLVWRRE
jgi:hypothetical protein